MRKLSNLPVALVIAFLFAAISGCGGSEAAQGPSDVQEPTSEPESLDFSPIEGQWSGTGVEVGGIHFGIRMTLSASAKPGRVVGNVRYWELTAPDFPCFGSWFAESVDYPTFTVRERITDGQCPDGTVDLEFDEETGTLRYNFTVIGPAFQNASGTLTRDG